MPLNDYQSPLSANLGPWQNVYSDPATAQAIAAKFGGTVIPRPDGSGNYDVYYPKPSALPTVYTPSFPTVTPPRTTALAPPSFSAAPPENKSNQPRPGYLRNIVDAFSYNTMLFPYMANRYFPMALSQMEILRRAANYRARWFVIPDDIDQPLQPFDTLYFQINVAGGSYLYGYQFTSISALNPSGNPTETFNTDICVQAVDSCTGISLFEDFANGGGCNSNFTSRCLPIPLTQPRLILEPGLVNVQLSNTTPNTITCQLLMHFAEPCKTITEEDRQREFAMQNRRLRRITEAEYFQGVRR